MINVVHEKTKQFKNILKDKRNEIYFGEKPIFQDHWNYELLIIRA